MAGINTDWTYVLTNQLFGSGLVLASSTMNDSLVVAPPGTDGSRVWYLTNTLVEDYYQLHTIQKGDDYALDIFNYTDDETIYLHFDLTVQEDRQYWTFNGQDDGSFKISNYAVSDKFLDTDRDTMMPIMVDGDTSGQRWGVDHIENGVIATPTTSGTSTSPLETASSSSGVSTGAGSSSPEATGAGDSSSQSASSGLSGGAIAGAVIGGAVGGLLVIAAVSFLVWKRCFVNRGSRDVPLRPVPLRRPGVMNV